MDPRRLPPLQQHTSSGGSHFPPPPPPPLSRPIPHFPHHPHHPLPPPPPHWGPPLPPIVQDHLRHRPPPPLEQPTPSSAIPLLSLNTSALPQRQDSSLFRYDDHSAHPIHPPPSLPSNSAHTLQVASTTSSTAPTTTSTAQSSTTTVSKKRTNNTVDPMPPTSDFVKKLFRMLEDNKDEHLVSWSPSGDSFTVKDMNEFTKVILPRMFKHSNFASFVRQLNKYDFHKIKNEEAPGDSSQSWTFRHPDFQRSNYAALENIKRKVPATRKSNSAVPSSSVNNNSTTGAGAAAGAGGVLGGGMKRSSSPLPFDDSPHAGGAPESPAPSYGAPSPAAAGHSYTTTGVNGPVPSNVPTQPSATIPGGYAPPSSTSSNSPSHTHSHFHSSHTVSSSSTATTTNANTNTNANAANIIYSLEAQLSELKETLTRQVRVLTARHDDLRLEHVALRKAYENTERELEMFRRTTTDQDVLIRQLAGWFSIQYTTRIPATPGGNAGPATQGQLPASGSPRQVQSQTSIPPQHQLPQQSQSQSQSPIHNTQPTAGGPLPTAEASVQNSQLPMSNPSSSSDVGPDAFLQTHEAAQMVAPPFTVKNNYLNSANAHIATAVLSNGADEHSLAEISLWRMNEISRRATQANMQFNMVPPSTTSQQPQQGASQVQQSAGASTAPAGASTATNSTIPMTEPKPVLVGMSREVALQRLQDLARVSSSDLTGVTGAKAGAGGLRSHPPTSPTKPKREEAGEDDEGGSGGDSSTDAGSDDEAGPRVYASQHAQRIPTGAGLKARNFTAYSASNNSPTASAAAPNPPAAPNTLMPMPRGAGGTLAQGDNHRGLSVLTVGHLVPRPFSTSGMSMSATGDGPGGPPSAGGPGTGVGPGGGWPMVMHNGASGPVPGVPGVGLGVNVPIDPMYRIPSPPAASPPSLSATDRRPLVHAYPPPTSPPPSLSPSIPSSNALRSGGGGGSGSPTSPRQHKLRVRRSTYVPGWAVPPRVLLVEDDLVSRRLSSKFLQVSGCEIGVAVDGLGAVNKMELEKYDLVLMDIVMPKLDGISATSMIRQFDPMTPIISMTSNSKPSEILTYYSSGMNDILPKPFTRDGLLKMLEKHLMHLKHIRDFTTSIPRSIGEGITLPEGFVYSDATPSPSMLNGATPPLQITNGGAQTGHPFTSSSSATATANNNNNNLPAVTTTSNYSHISSADPANGQNAIFFSVGTAVDGSEANNGGGGGGGGGGTNGLINPLHGLGLNVEQYPSLLQNLLGMSSEALDAMEFDPNLLNDTMLGGPGDSMLTSFGGPPPPANGVSGPTGPASSPTHKRPRDDDGVDGLGPNGTAAKRSRFEEVVE